MLQRYAIISARSTCHRLVLNGVGPSATQIKPSYVLRGRAAIGLDYTTLTTERRDGNVEAKRSFHASHRREIWPLIVVPTILFVGRYTFKALRRMEQDRIEYEEYLESGGSTDPASAVDGSDKTTAVNKMVLGVDFGTSSLRCALLDGDKSSIVEDRDGARDTPSYVFYEEGSEPVLGRLAKQKLHVGPMEVLSVHDILSGEDRQKGVDAAALMLREVIVDAIEKKGAGMIGEVESVVTYAPNYTAVQQEILVDAAKSAGLIDPYVVCEPVGALIAARKLEIVPATTKAQNCVVVDVGHGVMHVSVVKDDDVVATKSSMIGGALLQDTLVQVLANKFEEKNNGMKLRDDKLSLQRLYDEVEGIAAELSKKSRVDVDLPYITADEKGPKHLNESISLNVVKSMVDELVKEDEGLAGDGVADVVMGDLMEVLTASKCTPFELGTILVVGGASLSPIFRDSVKEAAVKMGGEDFMVKVVNVVEGGGREDMVAMGASLALEGI